MNTSRLSIKKLRRASVILVTSYQISFSALLAATSVDER
jgi:hypothetical protein